MKFIGAMLVTLLGCLLFTLPFIGITNIADFGFSGWQEAQVVIGGVLTILSGGALITIGIWWGNKS